MIGHALATGRTSTLIKLGFAAAAKSSAAFMAFGLTALVTRNMAANEAGLFLLGFSLIAVLSVFFRLGLDNVILRFLSAHGTDAFSQEKLNRGLLWVATFVIPSTTLGMLFSDQIARHVFNKSDFGPVLFWMLLALPSMAIFMLLAMAFQSQHRVILATIFQNLGISTVFVAAFGYIWVEHREILNALTASQIYAGASYVICLAAIVTWFKQKGIRFTLPSYKDRELTSASSNLWMASNMSLITVWSGVLIAGAIVPGEDLAQLSAAQRTAMLTSFVLMVVNMVVAPRYAQMWKKGDVVGIQRLARWSTRGMIAMVSPIFLFMVFLPQQVMSVFGDNYEQAAPLLVIMVIGQFINVATGSVGYLLNMSGHEKDFRRITFFVGPLTIFLAFTFISIWGVTGAAYATAIGVSLQNLGAMLVVKKRLGFFPIT